MKDAGQVWLLYSMTLPLSLLLIAILSAYANGTAVQNNQESKE